MSGNKVLVYGGKGALGQAVAGFFKKESWVCWRNSIQHALSTKKPCFMRPLMVKL
jgi:hypothetical protein